MAGLEDPYFPATSHIHSTLANYDHQATAVASRKRERSNSASGSEQGPPGKIQALSGGDQDMDTLLPTLRRVPPKRDPTYYMEDGSCILLVDDTLFNVHRSILSKDSSSFSTMFTLPQGSREVEGTSDNNPIILHGDSPSDFRHFLWALYALPPELRIVTSPSADLLQLIAIARIANKYSFKTIETWALDVIQEYVVSKPSGAQVDSTEQLTRLLRLAQLCSHERLMSTMIDLLKKLMTSSLQYAYLAMTLADELDIRALRGTAYLEVMQKAVVVKKIRVNFASKPSSSSNSGAIQDLSSSSSSFSSLASAAAAPTRPLEGEIDEGGRLVVSREQQLRLLSGYYRLTGTWEDLRKAPPFFEHSASCSATWHLQGCSQSWLEFWKDKTKSDAVAAFGLADVLGRLRQVQKEYDKWGSATYMHHDCRMIARRSILDTIKKVEEALPDYFVEATGDVEE